MKLKALFTTIVAIFIAIPIFAQTVHSLPKPAQKTPQTLTTSTQNFSEPPCYFKTESGNTIDLSNLCNQPNNVPAAPRISYPSPPNVYNQDTLRNFDDALYGSDHKTSVHKTI